MQPVTAKAWTRILRDVAIVIVGAFMLVHETLNETPNAYIIGAGLVALGLPPALRLDARRGADDGEH